MTTGTVIGTVWGGTYESTKTVYEYIIPDLFDGRGNPRSFNPKIYHEEFEQPQTVLSNLIVSPVLNGIKGAAAGGAAGMAVGFFVPV